MRKGETECIRFERAMAKMEAEKKKQAEALKAFKGKGKKKDEE